MNCGKLSLNNPYSVTLEATGIFRNASLQPKGTFLTIKPCFCPLYTSTMCQKSKGKKEKAIKKIQQVIRHTDAAEVLDLDEVQQNMIDKVEQLKTDFAKDFRIGSDIPLDQVEIIIEGDSYLLNEVAQITKPSPRLVQVDMISFPEFVKTAENAIRSSRWNLNPSVSGTIIKVPIPQPSAEHRATVAKAAKQRFGDCKRELHDLVKETESFLKQQKIAKDFDFVLKQQINIYCDHYIAEAETMFKGKEKELLHPS